MHKFNENFSECLLGAIRFFMLFSSFFVVCRIYKSVFRLTLNGIVPLHCTGNSPPFFLIQFCATWLKLKSESFEKAVSWVAVRVCVSTEMVTISIPSQAKLIEWDLNIRTPANPEEIWLAHTWKQIKGSNSSEASSDTRNIIFIHNVKPIEYNQNMRKQKPDEAPRLKFSANA